MGGPSSGMAHFQFTKCAPTKNLPSFPRLVNRHHTESEWPRSLAGKATFLQKRIHFSTARECLDRAAEILIRLLALRGPMRQARQYMMEIQAIKRQQWLPLRQRKIQNKHDAAGPENAVHLQDRRFPIRHVAQAKGDRQDIKRIVAKGQRQAIRLDQPFDTLEARLFEHGQAKISSRDSRRRAGLFYSQCQIPAACGEIENFGRAARCHKPRQLGSPNEIHTATEKVVCQIIPSSDRCEGASHELRIFLGKLMVHFFSISGKGWCSREDSNLHGLPHTILSRMRLPVPPREQRGDEDASPQPPCKSEFQKNTKGDVGIPLLSRRARNPFGFKSRNFAARRGF